MENNLKSVPTTQDNVTHWDLLPKKLRKQIQRQYKRELKQPSNQDLTCAQLMEKIGEKLAIKFEIE